MMRKDDTISGKRLIRPIIAVIVLVSFQSSIDSRAQSDPANLPIKECPVLILRRLGGLGTESQGGVLAAVWQSGVILRSESAKRPSGPHVVGRVGAADLAALLASVRRSRLWSRRSGGLALDMPSEELELQRGRDRIGWAETPGVTSTVEFGRIRERVFKVRIEERVRVVTPIADEWSCPAVKWNR
jgi:hypothetical protein